ncbi:Hypothetical predicted protein [Olea europaea subsp. europaea]|uniref:Uncharacterized protein n=1 Tax=Olea europaea subsp. europaea TaxID=158383 RepID=A0A8S0U8I1_OLEEU|nr:Hypothetical predicted protein [Olea europaea subsp. europaea]
MEMDYLNLVNSDMYFDLECARTKDKQLDEEFAFVKQLEKETDIEQSYKDLLLCHLTKEVRFVPSKRKNEKDDISEHDEDWSHEENDPQYELFLRNLEKHEKSYVFNHKKNGSCLFIRYEEDSDSEDDDSDPESQRKLTDHKPRRKLTNTVEGEKIEAMRCSSDSIMPDSDYLFFMQNTKIEGDYLILSHDDGTIIYEKDGIVISPEKGDNDDGLEILDIAPAWKDETENFIFIEQDSSKMHSDFREELVCILQKQYDREEYKKLRKDVEVRKAALRHRELRNGRENAYSTDKAGKSYLDRYPDLKEALIRCQDDKPRCLNLLRGFFFWLQCLTREGAFKPWKDQECLAVEPIRCPPLDPERKIKQAMK